MCAIAGGRQEIASKVEVKGGHPDGAVKAVRGECEVSKDIKDAQCKKLNKTVKKSNAKNHEEKDMLCCDVHASFLCGSFGNAHSQSSENYSFKPLSLHMRIDSVWQPRATSYSATVRKPCR